VNESESSVYLKSIIISVQTGGTVCLHIFKEGGYPPSAPTNNNIWLNGLYTRTSLVRNKVGKKGGKPRGSNLVPLYDVHSPPLHECIRDTDGPTYLEGGVDPCPQ
jgi:hypothetical protein